MLRKLFLLFFFLVSANFILLLPFFAYCQLPTANFKIDSLLTHLKKDKEACPEPCRGDTSKVIHLNKLCREYINIGSYDTALHYGNAALRLARQLNFPKGITTAYDNIGIIHNYQGNYEKALEDFFVSLKIKEGIGDQKGIAASYNHIGLIYDEHGKYEKALENHFASLKIREEIGDKKGIAASYNNIAIIYGKRGNYEKALEKCFASLNISKEIDDKQVAAGSYNNIGKIYFGQGNLSRQRGDTAQADRDYDKALENYFASLKIYEKIGGKEGIATSYINIGNAYMAKNNYAEANTYLLNSLRLFKETGVKDGMMEAYQKLSEVNEKTNDYKNAHTYYQLYSQIRDSIFNEESSKQIAEMQTKYETEKKEKEIELQKAEIARKESEFSNFKDIIIGSALAALLLIGAFFFFLNIRRKNEKLKMEKQMIELEQQALRMQMNPHFIFNCLGSISNFIGRNEPAEAKKYLAKFAGLMRLILENSRESAVSLQNEIDALQHYLELEQLRFGNKFTFTIDADETVTPEMITIPPMLIQPHVENAILHGLSHKEENGRIQIRFKPACADASAGRSENSHIVCEIEDNGIGRKKSVEMKEGTEDAHKSMAMQIFHRRLAMLNEKNQQDSIVNIQDMQDEQKNPLGTKVIFHIPVQINSKFKDQNSK